MQKCGSNYVKTILMLIRTAIFFQPRLPRECLHFGGKVDPNNANVVVHDQIQDDAHPSKVSLHLQLERPFKDLAWNDWNHSNGDQS